MGFFLSRLSSIFLVLVPKVEGASNIKDFMPISLVGYTYKPITKDLAKTSCSG